MIRSGQRMHRWRVTGEGKHAQGFWGPDAAPAPCGPGPLSESRPSGRDRWCECSVGEGAGLLRCWCDRHGKVHYSRWPCSPYVYRCVAAAIRFIAFDRVSDPVSRIRSLVNKVPNETAQHRAGRASVLRGRDDCMICTSHVCSKLLIYSIRSLCC